MTDSNDINVRISKQIGRTEGWAAAAAFFSGLLAAVCITVVLFFASQAAGRSKQNCNNIAATAGSIESLLTQILGSPEAKKLKPTDPKISPYYRAYTKMDSIRLHACD